MTTSQLGRTQEVNWPDLNDPAPGWVATNQASIEVLSNNSLGRHVELTGINDSTSTEITHGLGIAKDYLKIIFFSGTGATKSLITDPIAAGWTITAGTNPLTQVQVGTPSSGQPHDFTVMIVDVALYRETMEQLIASAPAVPPAGHAVKWRDSNGVGFYRLNSGYIGTLESLPVKHESSNFNADPGFHYVVDTSGGAVTATMPAGVQDYYQIQFSDAQKTFNTNNLTIARNGNNIDSAAEDLVLSTPGDGALLVGDNAQSNWVRASAGGAGSDAAAGGVNYYDNPLFENDLSGAALDAGVATLTAETTDPIQGNQSLAITQGVGAAADVKFDISGIDRYVTDDSIIPAHEAFIRCDAADADGDVQFGLWNETDSVWAQGPVDLDGGGVLNVVKELTSVALVAGKVYKGRLLRTDNTDTRKVIIDKLVLDPENGGAVVPEATETSLGVVKKETTIALTNLAIGPGANAWAAGSLAGTLTEGNWLIIGSFSYLTSQLGTVVSGSYATNGSNDASGLFGFAQSWAQPTGGLAGPNNDMVMGYMGYITVAVGATQDIYPKAFSEDAAVSVSMRGTAIRLS